MSLHVLIGVLAAAAAFVLVGNPASLVHDTPGGNDYTMVASAGTFALIGSSATLTVQRRVTVDAGTFALDGGAAALTAQRGISASPSSFALTGSSAGLTAQRKLSADTAAFVLVGVDAQLYVPVILESLSSVALHETRHYSLAMSSSFETVVLDERITRWTCRTQPKTSTLSYTEQLTSRPVGTTLRTTLET